MMYKIDEDLLNSLFGRRPTNQELQSIIDSGYASDAYREACQEMLRLRKAYPEPVLEIDRSAFDAAWKVADDKFYGIEAVMTGMDAKEVLWKELEKRGKK